MNQALWVAKTGLDAQEYSVRSITNNIANVNTNGYKRSRAVFESLLYQTVRQPGGQTSEDTSLPTGLMLGTGVKTASTEKIFTEGGVVQTDNQFDVMIQGRGFFQVSMPDGSTSYTRDGHFHPDGEGKLVSANGYELSGGITVPEGTTSVTIGSDGIISAVTATNSTPAEVGRMELADFINPGGLQPVGQNLYIETAASGSAQTGTAGSNGLGAVRQGALEGSNVNIVEELVGLIEAQRAYEMNSKAISSIDSMMQYADQVL